MLLHSVLKLSPIYSMMRLLNLSIEVNCSPFQRLTIDFFSGQAIGKQLAANSLFHSVEKATTFSLYRIFFRFVNSSSNVNTLREKEEEEVVKKAEHRRGEQREEGNQQLFSPLQPHLDDDKDDSDVAQPEKRGIRRIPKSLPTKPRKDMKKELQTQWLASPHSYHYPVLNLSWKTNQNNSIPQGSYSAAAKKGTHICPSVYKYYADLIKASQVCCLPANHYCGGQR